MCGLAGLLTDRAERRAALVPSIERMIGAIVHRGPDGSGIWTDPECGVGLGFRRLAILDLSPAGDQPMHSSSQRFVITFNGELYNHRALRAELAVLGHQFRGHSDTAVLLAALEQWGMRATLPRLVGMYAIALWDRRERELILIRDRLGKKPLYVFSKDGLVLFASELKAIAPDPDFDASVDPDAVAAFLRYACVSAPASIYRHVMKIPPAHFLVLRDATGALPAPERYWDAREVARAGLATRIASIEDAVGQLAVLLDDATRIRLESDVPLGALLSGGIDSSLVVARMQRLSSRPVRTFTIGFEEASWDESAHAEQVARHLGTEHTLLGITGAEALAVVPEIPDLFDEPFADASQVPTVLVCRLARRAVTVALCGDGGDEVFGGYNRYLHGPRMIERLLAVPTAVRGIAGRALMRVPADRWEGWADRILPARWRPRALGEKLQKVAGLLQTRTTAEGYRSLLSGNQDVAALLREGRDRAGINEEIFEARNDLSIGERMMLADQLNYLPEDLLAKMDRASSSTSLEVRAPLLDHRIVEFAWRLPMEMKIRQGVSKWILRELLARDVPRALFERPKMGFSVPLRSWLTGPLRPWAEDLLSTSSLRQVDVLEPKEVQRRWAALLAGRGRDGQGMWSILQLIAWWRRWMPSVAA